MTPPRFGASWVLACFFDASAKAQDMHAAEFSFVRQWCACTGIWTESPLAKAAQ